MTRDDKLRSRISDLAEGVEISEISLDKVQARGRRRNLNQRMVALAAAFLLVVGVAGVVRIIGDDEATLDVAVDVGSGDEAAATTAESLEPATSAGLDQLRAEAAVGAADSAFGFAGGPNQVLPWGEGFVSFGQVWHESTTTMGDLVPDLEDRFPPEIVEALADAGTDSANVQESMDALAEVGLLNLATEIVQSDPELLDAYYAATSGTVTFEAQVSDDGVTWTDISDFSLPNGNENLGFVQSDGVHLLIANQNWTEPDESTDVEISITTDLATWTTVTIPVDRPSSVPQFASVNTNVTGLAIGPVGWYVTAETHSWVDVWSLLPVHITTEMEQNGWGYSATADGIRLESYREPDADFDQPVLPAASSLSSEGPQPPIPVGERPQPTLERLIVWSELGLVYDDYADYLDNSPESAAWVGRWDGGITSANAPTPGNCCTVIGTDAGYLAMAWDGYELSGLDRSPASSLYFSPDGHSWRNVSSPDTEGFTDSIAAVDGGVLLTASTETGQSIWRGDADGTNWREVELPSAASHTRLWFGQGSGGGVAAVIDIATFEDAGSFVAPAEETIEHNGYEIYNHQFADERSASLRITNLATGELVLEDTGFSLDGPLPASGEPSEDGGFTFIDAEGAVIVDV